MPNTPMKTLLFLSSYAPLFVILYLRGTFKNPAVSIGLLVLAILVTAALLAFLRQAKRFDAHRVVIDEASGKSSEAMSYIVTYLIPFVGVGAAGIRELVSLGIVFIVLGILYVHSNLIHMNPTLSLLGYHVFEIQPHGSIRKVLISRRGFLRPGTEAMVVRLSETVLLEKEDGT